MRRARGTETSQLQKANVEARTAEGNMFETNNRDSYNVVARAYGVLSTSLSEALADARNAVSPHGNLLVAGRMAELDELLAEFARRRTRIAVYGEVKAGKSTLINAISGADLSP